MQLLTIITLVYAGILVLALAVTLILTLVYLIRISSTLGQVRSSLAEVARQSEVLHDHFEPLPEELKSSLENLQETQEHLSILSDSVSEPVETAAR